MIMIEYASKKDVLKTFNKFTIEQNIENKIHDEFIIIQNDYTYNFYTEFYVYCISIYSRDNQIKTSIYHKTIDTEKTTYLNVRSNVINEILEQFNRFKKNLLGY